MGTSHRQSVESALQPTSVPKPPITIYQE